MTKKQTVQEEEIKLTKLQEEEKKLIETYLEDLKRVQADFENYIKRSNKEKEELGKISKASLVLKLTSVLEDFERALASINQNDDIKNGIGMIFKQLHKILHEEGLKSIESKGKKFDYHLHEVVKQIESDKEEGIILDEIQKGYIFHDKVLRPSKVIVSKGAKENG